MLTSEHKSGEPFTSVMITMHGISAGLVRFEVESTGIALHLYLDEPGTDIRVDLREQHSDTWDRDLAGLRTLAATAAAMADHLEAHQRAARIDSGSWECSGCGGRCIGEQTLTGLCRGCEV